MQGPATGGSKATCYTDSEGQNDNNRKTCSFRHRYLFFAVPKTASTSIVQALLAQDDAELIPPKHKYAKEARRDLPRDIWSGYFKFAFVRNPFDWMASWYFYRSQNNFRDGADPYHSFTGDRSFADFVRYDTEWPRTQTEFLTDDTGQWLMDFVGNYECLQEHFDLVCERLGMGKQRLPKLNISPNEIHPSSLYDDELVRLVAERNADLIEEFGYTPDYRNKRDLIKRALQRHVILKSRTLKRSIALLGKNRPRWGSG